MAKRALALRIAGLQNTFVRRINDIHIFIGKTTPLIVQTKAELSKSADEKDREYTVPDRRKKKGIAKRTDEEMAKILGRFATTELFQTFLGTSIAQFESFLGKVLGEILTEYPRKLTTSVSGVPPVKDIPINILLDSDTVQEAIQWAIDKAVSNLFYAQPKAYMEYLNEVAEIVTQDKAFKDYFELKATRDLIVHNSGVINDVYLGKAGDKARGELGETVRVDAKYFNHALATLKRLSGIIKKDVQKAFPVKLNQET